MVRDYIAYSPIPRTAEISISITGDTFFLNSGFERYKTAARTTVRRSAFQSTINPAVSDRQCVMTINTPVAMTNPIMQGFSPRSAA